MKHNPTAWRFLNRREFLVSGAAAVASMNGLASTPSCVLASEQEEGPYYVDGAKLRGDITEGKPGVPLKLRVALVDAKRCSPLANAALDIWHCDALGVYSGFTANRPGGPGPRKIDETRFLRGVQISNPQGVVEFTSLYPGWYQGRAIHIHLKVHTGEHVSHTGQLYFPEEFTERIAKTEPYSKRLQIHRTTQEEDGIFGSQNGSSSMVHLERIRNGSDTDGYVATVTLAVDPEATPAPVGRGGPGGPRPRRPFNP